jgi:hypothetical protein
MNLGLTKKSQKANFTLLTEPVDRIFWGNTDFLVSPYLRGMIILLAASGGELNPKRLKNGNRYLDNNPSKWNKIG